MNPLPPLNGLRAFEAAGRYLNFRAAADDIGVTQGAVAQQVRGLEARLGVRLFDRRSKGLAFTDIGRAYHTRIADAFAVMQQATDSLRPQTGKVTISVTPSFAAKWLIPNLPSFTETYPNIDLRVLATEATSSFQTDGIDLAIRLGRPPFGASLDATLLFENEIIAVAAPSLIGGRIAPLPPGAITSFLKLHTSHDLWPGFLAQMGVVGDSSRGMRFSQTALAIDAAAAGQGVALTSRFMVAADLNSGRLCQVLSHVMRGAGDFYLLSPRNVRPSDDIDKVVAWLTDQVTASSALG